MCSMVSMNNYYDDIKSYIDSNIIDTIVMYIEDHTYLTKLKKDTYDIIINIYNNIDTNKETANNNLINKSHKYCIETIINNYFAILITNISDYNKRSNILTNLLKLKLPEQRSIEWFAIRKSVITASSFASVLNKCQYKSRDELLLEKIEDNNKPYVSNPITEWGVKYEEIATKFYESMNNIKIKEFGMIPHPDFPIFGASPDGICDFGSIELTGRMLEIKCPPKRKFTKSVPKHYWIQMQGQLECCNLDECDFLQVKLNDYNSFEDYCSDTNGSNGYTSIGLPKGVTVTYKEIFSEKNSYLYPDLYLSDDQYVDWINAQKKWISDNEYEFVESKWWFIERFECTLVKRDKNWWDQNMCHLIQFWKDVEYYKLNGYDELIQRCEQTKYKHKRVTIIKPSDNKNCLID